MKKDKYFVFTLTILLTSLSYTGKGQILDSQILWEIGKPDNLSNEFALSPNGYKGYPRQFGNFSQYYVIGKSKPEKDWPYCLPGSVDEWAGIGYYSWRKSVQQVLFDVQEVQIA